MEDKVRSWLRQNLLDAEEAQRTWRLRCIQAEAELRALQAEVPGKDSADDQSEDMSGAVDTVLAANGQQEGQQSDSDAQVLLGQVLGLEKHCAELQPWKAKSLDETSRLQAEAEVLQAKLKEQSCLLKLARSEARVTAEKAQKISGLRAAAKAVHDEKCGELAHQVHEFLLSAGLRPSFEGELLSLKHAEAEMRRIDASVSKLEADSMEATRQRELLRMRREEMRGIRWGCIDTRAQCAREVAYLRQISKSRQATLTRLQGEVLRSDFRGAKKRKQMEDQIGACNTELADALSRADAAGDKLRKVKFQHGKQLQKVRLEHGSLQAEVDDHLNYAEASEEEFASLRQQELDLEGSEQRHLTNEQALEVAARSLGEELSRLEEAALDQEDQRLAVLDGLWPLQDESRALRLTAVSLREQGQADSQAALEAQSATEQLETDMAAERGQWATQAHELTVFKELEDQVQEARERRDASLAERAKLDESLKLLQQGSDRQLSDLREIQRRSLQLKAVHDDLLKALPSSNARGREAIQAALDQVLGRARKKADALLNYLEAGPGPAKRASTGGAAVGDTQFWTQRLHSS
ncbi:unnamed protein product [Polarella glacialis]|uniref:Uncharacterized protein n=1 Tax=Polarella glacialis TaxID=89957 RepID=A0A813KLT7_POLGL|nr:unnamed protein product [Polarella glacialis]